MNGEVNLGVGRASVRITLLDNPELLSIYFVALRDRNRAVVYPGLDEFLRIVAPPVTVKAMHLFLSNEFG